MEHEASSDRANGVPARTSGSGGASYDLWVDFASMADDGTLWTQSSNLRPGLRVSPGDVVTVGSEDAVPARARVISVAGGAIVVRVIGDATAVPGSV